MTDEKRGLEGVARLQVRCYQGKREDGRDWGGLSSGGWPESKMDGQHIRDVNRGGNAQWGGRYWFTATCYDADGQSHQTEDTVERGLDWRCHWILEDPAGGLRLEIHPTKIPELWEAAGEFPTVHVVHAPWAWALSYNFSLVPLEDLHGGKLTLWAYVADAVGRRKESNRLTFGVS